MGLSAWLLELPHSMVAKFQERGRSSHQPFPRVGPELALHHFRYILLSKILNGPVQIQGDKRSIFHLSLCVGWLQQMLSSLIH